MFFEGEGNPFDGENPFPDEWQDLASRIVSNKESDTAGRCDACRFPFTWDVLKVVDLAPVAYALTLCPGCRERSVL